MLSPESEHDQAVDMWSVGVLAIQLLSGREQLRSIEHLNTLLEMLRDAADADLLANIAQLLEQALGELDDVRDEQLSVQGRDFLRSCLTSCPQQRITAKEAGIHPWLCEPGEDEQLFVTREKENTAAWQPRHVLSTIFEQLPDVLTMPNGMPKFSTTINPSASKEIFSKPAKAGKSGAGMLAPPLPLKSSNPKRSPHFTSNPGKQIFANPRKSAPAKVKRSGGRVPNQRLVSKYSLHAYQGLEKHLTPRRKDGRMKVLKELWRSGKMFMPSSSPSPRRETNIEGK